MKILVACEFSGVVREAFSLLGHDAWSCDIIDTEIPGNHYKCNVIDILHLEWDMLIAHPPCTAVSGSRWFSQRVQEQSDALDFVRLLMDAPVHKICIENPVSVISSKIRKPDQYIQPWQFGHGETKKTCLWLKNLPPLTPTDIVAGRDAKIHYMPPGPNRGRERSRTYAGIAKAMAEQWGTI